LKADKAGNGRAERHEDVDADKARWEWIVFNA